MNTANYLTNHIKAAIRSSSSAAKYREPLVGFASAHDQLFTEMKKVIGEHHLHPTQLLPEAETVVSFFLPFSEKVIKENRQANGVARSWCVAYIETNKLIGTVCQTLTEELAAMNITAAFIGATHNFNQEDLTAAWSHKSIAYVAGLGTFGIHKMLITPSGCAGRFGSVVISTFIPPTKRPAESLCRYHQTGKCLYCVKNCPTGALQINSLDKKKCYEHLLEVDKRFPDLELCDVCGKCAVGPCASYL